LQADFLVGPDNARPAFFPTVLTAVLAAPPPKSMSKEWQEASNERARELNLDPITGKRSRSLIPPLGLPDSFQLPFRRAIRGLFRKGLRTIQVDSRGTQVGSRAGSSGMRLCFILAHNQIYFAVPHITIQGPFPVTMGCYAFHVRSFQKVYSALASFASFSFSPSLSPSAFSSFSSDSPSSALPMLALLSTNV